jgi:ribosomal-protein-alanine N-acetyltransferase
MGEVASPRAPLPSDRVPPEDFDAERFTAENLAFWVPLLVALGRIEAEDWVLDVGCGTGGFAAAIASATGAHVVGCDRSLAFLEYARARSAAVEWVAGDAERLPFDAGSFDCVLLSLVLHQLSDPSRAVMEAFRVLRRPGHLLVRTVLPVDAAARVPFRFVPALAEAQAMLMPSLDDVVGWARAAGFDHVRTRRVCRNKRLHVDEVEAQLRKEAGRRYAFLAQAELEEGVRRMRGVCGLADAVRRSPAHVVRRREEVIERLETDRLVGERLREAHFAYQRAMDTDRAVMATLGGVRSENESWEQLRSGLEHWERNGFGPWVFQVRETGETVGGAALRRVEIEGQPEVEVGYRVAAAWWGRGIATEMASAVVGVARGLGLEEIVAFTLPDNLASRRVMEKAGFTYERDIEWAALPHVLYRQRLA